MKKSIKKKKVKKNFGLMAIIVLVAGFTLGMILKGTYSTFGGQTGQIGLANNYLKLECDKDIVDIGDTVKCSITGNAIGISIYSVNANYVYDESFEYKDFIIPSGVSSFDEIYASSNLGFAVVKNAGLTGNFNVGEVEFLVKDSALAGTTYNISLDNREYSLTDYSIKDDVKLEGSATIRVKSNVNLLKEIKITGEGYTKVYEADNLASSSVIKLNLSKDMDKINITTTVMDNSNATLSSNANANNVELNYGTNRLEILVTSENGKEKVYTLDIYREFDLDITNGYIYDSDHGYLYTGIDTDKSTIITNLNLANYLTGVINDGKLVISNSSEELLNVEVLNFVYNGTILDNDLLIAKDMNYNEFKSLFTMNDDLEMLILNSLDGEDTNQKVKSGDKVEIYYGDRKLKTYNVKIGSLTFSEELSIDNEKNIIKNIIAGTKVEEIKSLINSNGSVIIANSSGVVKENDEVVKTNDRLIIRHDNQEYIYTLSVLGDVNGSGNITITDISKLYRYFKGKVELTDAEICAADVATNGNITITDVSKLYRYFKGKITSLEG